MLCTKAVCGALPPAPKRRTHACKMREGLKRRQSRGPVTSTLLHSARTSARRPRHVDAKLDVSAAFDDELCKVSFCDSVTGKVLFVAPTGRSMQDFLQETDKHGWPSFRDEEVVWESVRVLSDGETVSVDGTHLGHLIPDESGPRYCINLCSVAGTPPPPLSENSIRDALRRL